MVQAAVQKSIRNAVSRAHHCLPIKKAHKLHAFLNGCSVRIMYLLMIVKKSACIRLKNMCLNSLNILEEAWSLLSIVMVIAADFRGLTVFLLLSIIVVCLAATFPPCLHARSVSAADLAMLVELAPTDEGVFVAQRQAEMDTASTRTPEFAMALYLRNKECLTQKV